MFGNPRDVLIFKPKEELEKIHNNISSDGRECNLCWLRTYCYEYNGYIPSEQDSVRNEGDEFYYTDGKHCDICSYCMEKYYPDSHEIMEATIFFGIIYDHLHYYPNFPELRQILFQYRNIEDTLKIDIRNLKYKGVYILDMMPSYNCMLEFMDLFGLSLNEILKRFIASIDEKSLEINLEESAYSVPKLNRDVNLYEMGFGLKFPNPEMVIYKFFEKFIRHAIKYKIAYRPSKADLEKPKREDYDNDREEYYSYEMGRYNEKIELDKKLREFTNRKKLCNSEIWKNHEIWKVPYMHDVCYYIENHEDWFLGKFNYENSINKETKEILDEFLKDFDHSSYVEMENQGEINLGKIKCNNDQGWNNASIAKLYNIIEDENLFKLALYKFKENINKKEEVLNILEKDCRIPKDIIKYHLKYEILQ